MSTCTEYRNGSSWYGCRTYVIYSYLGLARKILQFPSVIQKVTHLHFPFYFLFSRKDENRCCSERPCCYGKVIGVAWNEFWVRRRRISLFRKPQDFEAQEEEMCTCEFTLLFFWTWSSRHKLPQSGTLGCYGNCRCLRAWTVVMCVERSRRGVCGWLVWRRCCIPRLSACCCSVSGPPCSTSYPSHLSLWNVIIR
jgi:hypothetical protein